MSILAHRPRPDSFERINCPHVSIKQTGLVILGDFNVHYGNVDDKNASDLAAILNDTNLQQHVTSATHYRDNILDLVITPVTDSIVTDVSVESLLTDHHIIVCKLVSNKPRPIRKEIIYRNIAAIDKQTFAHDLCDTQLVTTPADDIVTLCDQYKSQLLALIDDHAPVIRRTVNVRARQPWRNDELQIMRQHVRQAERKWRHTRQWSTVKSTRTCVTLSNIAYLRPNQTTIAPRLNRLPEIPNRCITSQTTSWVVLVKLFCRNVTVAPLYWLNPSSPSSLPRLLIYVHA